MQVLIDGAPIEVQYTNDVLINARMPDAAPAQAVSKLVVVSNGLRSAPVDVRRLPETALISLDGVARVDGPVWIHVELPRSLGLSYPSMGLPWDFACGGFEVRRDGKLIAPMAHPQLGMGGNGPSCPGIVRLGDANVRSRLPLHLQYRFSEPGIYEVRLTHYGSFARRANDVRMQSAWTRIEVLPAAAKTAIGAHPQEPAAVVSDFLPNLVARPDDENLSVVLEYLYHASARVRSYAAAVLYYWPDAVVEPRLIETLRVNGPTPVVMERLRSRASEMVPGAIEYFFSDDPVLFQGAIAAARVALAEGTQIDQQLRARVEERLISFASGSLGRADPQSAVDVTSLLGQIHTQRAHEVLWNLADHHMGGDQTLVAIAWHKDPKDLPRITEFLLAQPAGEKGDQVFTGEPYAMRNSFGDAALPWLRTILEKARPVSLRIRCAEELMRANDPAGFAFAIDAIGGREWKADVRSIVSNLFPDARKMSDAELVKFLSSR